MKMEEVLIPLKDKKEEAVKRMKRLGIYEEVINQFEDEGKVNISESPYGSWFWANDKDMKDIKNVEAEYNILVYAVIRSHVRFDREDSVQEMDSYLYVSDYEEEWEIDNADLDEHTPLVYVHNNTVPEFSEFGSIAIEVTPAAGLRRVL